FRLEFSLPSNAGSLTLPIALVRGANAWQRSIDTATLVVETKNAASDGPQLSVVSSTDAWDFDAPLPAHGTPTLVVPAAACSIGRYERKPGLQLSEWKSELDLVLARGERRRPSCRSGRFAGVARGRTPAASRAPVACASRTVPTSAARSGSDSRPYT